MQHHVINSEYLIGRECTVIGDTLFDPSWKGLTGVIFACQFVQEDNSAALILYVLLDDGRIANLTSNEVRVGDRRLEPRLTELSS